MDDLTQPCCQSIKEQHGTPEEFVKQLFGGPAQSYEQFDDQRSQLEDAFIRIQACSHYQKPSKREHIELADDDFDNRVFNYCLPSTGRPDISADDPFLF